MRISNVVFGVLIVLAFFAGRWSSSRPPANPTIVAGMPPPPATHAHATPAPSAKGAPARPTQGQPPIAPQLPELPMLPDTPGVVRNTGPFVDADPGKSPLQQDPDQPVRNTGAFVEAGGPPYVHREEAAGTGRK